MLCFNKFRIQSERQFNQFDFSNLVCIFNCFTQNKSRAIISLHRAFELARQQLRDALGSISILISSISTLARAQLTRMVSNFSSACLDNSWAWILNCLTRVRLDRTAFSSTVQSLRAVSVPRMITEILCVSPRILFPAKSRVSILINDALVKS